MVSINRRQREPVKVSELDCVAEKFKFDLKSVGGLP